jgi:hypothetical protein
MIRTAHEFQGNNQSRNPCKNEFKKMLLSMIETHRQEIILEEWGDNGGIRSGEQHLARGWAPRPINTRPINTTSPKHPSMLDLNFSLYMLGASDRVATEQTVLTRVLQIAHTQVLVALSAQQQATDDVILFFHLFSNLRLESAPKLPTWKLSTVNFCGYPGPNSTVGTLSFQVRESGFGLREGGSAFSLDPAHGEIGVCCHRVYR